MTHGESAVQRLTPQQLALRKRTRIVFERTLQYIFLVLCLFLVLFPLYLSIVNSMKTTQQLLTDYFGLPSGFYLENYKKVLSKANVFLYLGNSVIVTIASALGVYFLVPYTSYVIARRMQRYRYFKFLYFFIIIGIFVPFQAKMLALVKWMSALGLKNTFGLVLLYWTGALCQDVFLIVGYIKTIPPDMEEAALIDGCSRVRMIHRIVYPVIAPMISACLIKDVLWFWNDFQQPLIMLKPSQATLQLFMYNFRSEYTVDYPVAYAAYFMSMIPVILAYCFMSKKITGGLAEGAVKS